MKKFMLIISIILPIFFISSQFIKTQQGIDFPDKNSIFNMSYLNNYDIDKESFVFVKEGHFWTKSGRIKFFGINLTFDACFPDHETAQKISAQLSGLGINIVRLHHIDRSEIWGINRQNFERFDPDQLDKLDYLINQLKINGIYVNMNLHVSWQYTNNKNHPAYDAIKNIECFRYGKGLDNFVPEFIDLQKKYALELFNHKNPYTGLAYKNDPVIAMIEINNENSMYRSLLAEQGFDFLPDVYKEYLDGRFVEYLKNKYISINEIKKSWIIEKNKAAEISGIMPFSPDNGWSVQITDKNKGGILLNGSSTDISLNYDEKNGFFQLFRKKINFQKQKNYTIVIEIKGAKDAKFNINTMRDQSPWDNLGLGKNIKLSGDSYETFILGWTAESNAVNCGRITLSAFEGAKKFTIKSVKLYEGRIYYNLLRNIHDINRIKLLSLRDFENAPLNYKKDFNDFFYKLEKDYWSGMIGFLKNEIAVKAPVTGTQLDYSYPDLAEVYDYADIHNYWQHPVFPDKRWDQNNYYVKNIPMLSEKNSTFSRISMHRIINKPYTISEYNHPFPNQYNSETVTMLSVISKLQDYDAVFFFNFLNDLKDIDSTSYFALFKKMNSKAYLPAASHIFRSGKIDCLKNSLELRINTPDYALLSEKIHRYKNPYFELINDYHKTSADFTLYEHLKLYINTGVYKDPINYDISGYNSNKPEKDVRFDWEKDFISCSNSYFSFEDDNVLSYIGFNSKDHFAFKNIKLKINGDKDKFFQFSILNKDNAIGNKGRYIIVLSGISYFDNAEYFDYDKKIAVDAKKDNYGIKIMAKINKGTNYEYIELFDYSLTLNLNDDFKNISVYKPDNYGLKLQEIKYIRKNNEIIIDFKALNGSVFYCIEIN